MGLRCRRHVQLLSNDVTHVMTVAGVKVPKGQGGFGENRLRLVARHPILAEWPVGERWVGSTGIEVALRRGSFEAVSFGLLQASLAPSIDQT